MKRIIVSSLVVLFGLMVILGGISKMGDSTARCGGRIMSSGDECVTTSTTGSETGRKTADEQQKSDQFANWVVMGVGALMVVFGTKSLVTGIRNRRKTPDANATVAMAPHAPAWQQPQPGAGQQPPVWNQQQPHPQQFPPQAPPQQQQQHPGWGPPPQR